VNDAEHIATGTRRYADGHTARTLPCGRPLTARNNVIVDVNTCSANPADTPVNIANQIAAKVALRGQAW
jgi:PknH-like extracellular domain